MSEVFVGYSCGGGVVLDCILMNTNQVITEIKPKQPCLLLTYLAHALQSWRATLSLACHVSGNLTLWLLPSSCFQTET